MLLVFRNPQFRLVWINAAFSDLGTVTFFMVQGWLAFTVTESPFWVGATAGMQGLGLMASSTFAGVLVDRVDRRKLLWGGQLVQAAMVLCLAALILSDRVQLWHVLGAGLLDGLVLAVRMPARMALTLDVVGRKRLLSATAANFAAMAIMGIVGPTLAGNVVSATDIGWAYVIMGGGYCSAAAVLLALRRVPGASRQQEGIGSPWSDLKQGVQYAFNTPAVRTLILMALVTEMFGWAHEPMLPVMAGDVLEVGASGLGYLLSAASAGGLIATVALSSMGDVKEKGRLLVGGHGAFGLGLIMFALSPWFQLSMGLLALTYGVVVVYEATIATLIQTSVPDEMRGRILSFQVFTWSFTGISGFHTGAIANVLGAPFAIGLGGGVVVLNALRLIGTIPRYRTEPEEPVAEG